MTTLHDLMGKNERDMASALSATPNLRDGRTGLDLQPIRGGFHVKDAADGLHCVDVMLMMYGWRLTRCDKRPGERTHWIVDRAWCYFGAGEDEYGQPRTMEQAFANAVIAAHVWDGIGEPTGFDKVAGA